MPNKYLERLKNYLFSGNNNIWMTILAILAFVILVCILFGVAISVLALVVHIAWNLILVGMFELSPALNWLQCYGIAVIILIIRALK